MINKLLFLFSESTRSISRNIVHTIISSLAIAVSLIVFSMAYLLYQAWNNHVSEVTSKYKISVFFNYDLERDEIKELYQNIWKIDGLENGSILYSEEVAKEIIDNLNNKKDSTHVKKSIEIIKGRTAFGFPARIQFSIMEDNRNKKEIDIIIKKIKKIGGDEKFTDKGNDIYDEGEKYTDGNEKYDEGEEFTDSNSNGKWDESEKYIDKKNGQWDEGEEFVDVGNGIWDEGEDFEDLNKNKKYDFDRIQLINFDFETLKNTNDKILNIFGFIIIVVVSIALVAIFYVSNTILLVIYSRKQDMEILKLLGASNNFIKFPYIIEGIIFGLIGSIISLSFLGIASYLFRYLSESTEFLISGNEIFLLILLNVFIGSFLGFLGSSKALSSYIKNK